MAVRLIVPNIDSDEWAKREVSRAVNEMLLTPENIDKVMGDAEKYRGCVFVVMGRSIHCRKSMSEFNVKVASLVSVCCQCNWGFEIIAEPVFQSIEEGLMSIDKAVRGYVTMAERVLS